MKQRIIYIIDKWIRAGTQLQVAMLAEGLAERGHDVTLIFLEKTAGQPSPDLKGVRTIVHPVGRLTRPLAYVDVIKLAFQLRRLRPDVLHTYLFKANWVGTVAGRLAGVPIILTSRRSLGYDLTGRRATIQRFVNQFTDCVVGNAAIVLERAEELEGSLPSSAIIKNGVRISEHNAIDSVSGAKTSRPGGQRIGMLANVRPVKGHMIMLRAFRWILEAAPDARLELMGSRTSDPAWTLECDQLADTFGISDRITWWDPRTPTEDFFSAVDVLALPSLSEGLSNALLEGMAFGLPIVATDVGGNREALANAGTVIPASYAPALATALLAYLLHPDKAASAGAAARERAVNHFSPEQMVERHESLYLTLADEKANQTGTVRGASHKTLSREADSSISCNIT
jgi:glycosyltransferase involved in cell wall biosynthesis